MLREDGSVEDVTFAVAVHPPRGLRRIWWEVSDFRTSDGEPLTLAKGDELVLRVSRGPA